MSASDSPPSNPAEQRRLLQNQSVRYLAAREHSRRELEQKLARRGHDAGLVGEVLDELRRDGLQSDERFLESYLRSRVARGYGPMAIRAELRSRGIGDDALDDAITRSDEYWLAVAEQARAKRFGEADPADRADWNRQARFLSRRGFPADLIYRVLEDPHD
jgi:regulatory protein